MYWNFKFRVLQGASVLPFFFLILLQIPGTVSFFQPNSISMSPTSGTFEKGSTVTVNCNTSGDPIPTVSWYRYNSTNLVTDNIFNNVIGTTIQSRMSFTAAVSDHSRSVICTARNNQSSTAVQASGVFNVKATPSMTFTGPSLYTIDPNINTRANIVHTCVASRGFQSPSLRITFGLLTLTASSNFVVQNSDDQTFNVTSILTWKPLLNDNGTYLICNDTVSGQARQILIIVQQVPLMTIASSYSGNYGGSVTLNCSTSSTLAVTGYNWFKDNNILTIDMNKYVISGNGQYLTINSLVNSDVGLYKCNASNAAGSAMSSTTSLNVISTSPTASLPVSYSGDSGQSVTLNCSTTGIPAPSIVWLKDGAALTFTSRHMTSGNSQYLTINSLVGGDAGAYRCNVTNIIGSNISNAATLSVRTPPRVTVPNTTYAIVHGESVLLVCQVEEGFPTGFNVSWQQIKNGQSTVIDVAANSAKYDGSTASSPSLRINNATADDSGNYVCTARNSYAPSVGQSISLAVSGIPPSVVITGNVYTQVAGENLTIPCTVSGLPTATTRSWTFTPAGGSASTINSGSRFLIAALPNPSLTIIELRPSEAGLYKCRAINSVGQGEDNTTVVVSGGVPVVNIPQTGYSVLTGENTVLPCSTAANPAVTSSYWTHTTTNGQSSNITGTNAKYNFVSTATNSDLTIKNASAADAGSYVCVASNFIGSQQDSTNLAVTGSAPAIAIPNNVYDVVVGSDITIPCAMTASPALTASNWRITPASGTPAPFTVNTNSSKYTLLSDSSHYNLTVSSATFADAGSYQCNGANLVGTSDDSATLTVSGNVPNVTQSQSSWSVQKLRNITLDCTVSAVPAATSVHWNKTAGGVTTMIDTGSTDKYSGGTLGTPPLTILNARDSDEGNYVCIANNAAGQGTSGSAYLNVTGDFPALTITPSSGYSVLLTQNVTIQCSVLSANPAIDRIRWERTPDGGSTPVNVTIGGRFSGGTLSEPSLIISFAESTDQGRYRCIGRNTVGEGSSNSVQLQVTGSSPSAPVLSTSAVNVTRGGSTTITCSSSGDPAPTITWYNAQGAVVTSTGGTLTLSSVSIGDHGTYTCRASNAISTSSSAVNVNVQYSPIDNNSIRTLSAAVPSTVTLECKTSSNPAISSYTWSKSGTVISGATTSTLTRQITNTNDLGTYTCTAVNNLGSLSIGFTVSQSSQGGSVGASTVASAGLSSGEIAAIVLAILLLVILIIVLCFCCFSHGVCGMVCGKKESKAAVEPVKEKEVYKEKEVIIPRFHEESIKGVSKKAETYRYREPPAYREESRAGSFKSYPYANGDFRQPSAVSRKDVDVRVNHYRKENDYEIVRYESVAPAATTLGTIVSVPDDRQQTRPHHLPKIDYSYEEEERRRRHRRRKKKRRHHKEKRSEDVVRTSSPIRYIEDGGEDVVVERVIRRSPSPTRVYRPEPEEPMIIETVRRSGPPSRHHRYDDDDVIITERSLSRSPSRRRHEQQYITEGRVVNGEVIHDDSDLRAYNGVVVREPRLSRHGSGRYHVESERRHTSRSRHYDDDDDDGPEVVQGREYIIDK